MSLFQETGRNRRISGPGEPLTPVENAKALESHEAFFDGDHLKTHLSTCFYKSLCCRSIHLYSPRIINEVEKSSAPRASSSQSGPSW